MASQVPLNHESPFYVGFSRERSHSVVVTVAEYPMIGLSSGQIKGIFLVCSTQIKLENSLVFLSSYESHDRF